METLKQILKKKALEIFNLKKNLKEYQRTLDSDLDYDARMITDDLVGYYDKSLLIFKKEYRHHHIAYCELRGKKRDQIEKPIRAKQVDEAIIASIKTKHPFHKN